MISHKHRFIYLSIHKCGSTTLKSYFQKEAAGFDIDLRGYPVPSWLEKSGQVSLISLYPDYFVFTFVRNPFDRFLSFFLHRTRMMVLRIKNRTLLVDDPARDFIARADYCVPQPFSCLEECAEQKLGGLWDLKEDQYIGQTKYSYRQLRYERHHSRLQAHFLLDIHPPIDKGRSCLDGTPCSFIGRLETFEQDFTSLCSLLRLPNLPIKGRRVSQERGVAAKRRHYSTFYTKRARKLVEEIYARDLDLLGYEFEDETKTSVPVPLYAMDQLQGRRTKTTPSCEHIGFRLHLMRLYVAKHLFLLHPKTTLLYLVVPRMAILNFLYQKLYKPLFRTQAK